MAGFMRAETALQIKKDIGYTDKRSECIRCEKFQRIEDHKDLVDVCNLFVDLGPMKVNPGGTCRHWVEKKSPCA